MPNPLSRQAHLMPSGGTACEVLGNHFAQLVVPFFLFLPQPVASRRGGDRDPHPALAGVHRQLRVAELGRRSCWLRGARATGALHAVLPGCPRTGPAAASRRCVRGDRRSRRLRCIVVAQLAAAAEPVLARQLMNASFNRWQLVNAYGAFGSVTRTRYEVVIEGRGRRAPAAEGTGRPTSSRASPGTCGAARGSSPRTTCASTGSCGSCRSPGSTSAGSSPCWRGCSPRIPPTLRLLRHDPFAGRLPALIRVRTFRYRFATRAERRADGSYWMRDHGRTVIGPVAARG